MTTKRALLPNRFMYSLAVGALALGAMTLTGCSSLSGPMHKQVTSHADTRADLGSSPAWMPSDAVDIDSATGTAGKSDETAPRTVVFTSSGGVDSEGCRTVPRKSAPVMAVKSAPDVYAATTVVRCGDWSMVSEKSRWVAWTPNNGDGGS
jgi:hypothetical protein